MCCVGSRNICFQSATNHGLSLHKLVGAHVWTEAEIDDRHQSNNSKQNKLNEPEKKPNNCAKVITIQISTHNFFPKVITKCQRKARCSTSSTK